MINPLDWIRSPSAPTIHERLLAEVIEQNRLLRIDLASRGVAPSRLSPQILVTPRRKLTEADVTVVTREDRLRQQQEDDEQAARALPDVATPPPPADSLPAPLPSSTANSTASPRGEG